MKKKSISIILILILIFTFSSAAVVYASANLFLSAPKQIDVGHNFNVSISTNINIKDFEFHCSLSYDSTVISYVSDSSPYNCLLDSSDGKINIVIDEKDGGVLKDNIITLKFKANNSGNAYINISNADASSVYEGDFYFPDTSCNVKIEEGVAPTPKTTTTTTKPKKTTITTVETIKTTTSTTTSAVTEESTTMPASSFEVRKPFMAIDFAGRKLNIADVVLTDEQIPLGFQSAKVKMNEHELDGYHSDEENLDLVLLSRAGVGPQLCFYDETSRLYIPYLRFVIDGELYHLTSFPSEKLPFAATKTKLEIRDIEVPVWELNVGDLINIEDYLNSYQKEIVESEDKEEVNSKTDIVADKDDSVSSHKDDKRSLYLLSLTKDNETKELFVYLSDTEDLFPYSQWYVPQIGTFLDLELIAPKENIQASTETEALATTSVSESTSTASSTEASQSTVATESKGAVASFIDHNGKLMAIIVIAVAVLLIIIFFIIRVISKKDNKEPLFSDQDIEQYLSEEKERPYSNETKNSSFPQVKDVSELDAENIN